MLKITTRIFTASAMSALLISMNTGAFACDGCAEGKSAVVAKTSTKKVVATTKPVAKTVASAKAAPKVAKKSGVKLTALTVASAKVVDSKAAPATCPMCAKEKAEAAKK